MLDCDCMIDCDTYDYDMNDMTEHTLDIVVPIVACPCVYT
jgi:hypothetical protein